MITFPKNHSKRVLATRGTLQADGIGGGGDQAEMVEVSAEAEELTRRHAVSCFGPSFPPKKRNAGLRACVICEVFALWFSITFSPNNQCQRVLAIRGTMQADGRGRGDGEAV